MEFNEDMIVTFSPQMLLAKETLDEVYDIEDPLERERIIALMMIQAKEHRMKGTFSKVIAEYNKELARLENEYTRQNAQGNSAVSLKYGADGRPLVEIANFSTILKNDEKFSSLKFNLLTNSPEIEDKKGRRKWNDADDAKAREYIEARYKIHHRSKYEDALWSVLRDREYHPVRELVELIEWDGQSRIETFLAKWMLCEDSDYTREVSRLIFAGGINRLYNPGCKYDDIPVLIGEKQGEGKSTLVRWLAMQDEFFAEITEIEGKQGIEALDGVWVGEFGELLALTKAREVEAAKEYITRQVDKCRLAYGRWVTDRPRQCIFIGTTNKRQFLTDKTGGRRFYPVIVHQSGYVLFDHEAEVKEDIRQCWAEAKALYDKGQLKPYAKRELLKQIREMQAQAIEDDYREGLIAEYLEDKEVTCVIDLWQNALKNEVIKPTKKDSNEIAEILYCKFGDQWEKQKGVKWTRDYGAQQVWYRIAPPPRIKEYAENQGDELPF